MAIIFMFSFLAVFLVVFAAFTIPVSSRSRVKQSLNRLSSYEASGSAAPTDELTFKDRIIWPLLERLGTVVKRWNTDERIDKTRQKLMLAGIRNIGAEKFETIRLVLGGLSLLFFLI
ncbi:MAG: hypothetical protein KAX16_00945, partial [Actinomycetia bacterium]|nr:hypothetical protein [Actinomycetes bacterium]